jgi:hypothetical protein
MASWKKSGRGLRPELFILVRRSSLVRACKPLPTEHRRHLTRRNQGLSSLPPMNFECELLDSGHSGQTFVPTRESICSETLSHQQRTFPVPT